MPRRSALLVLAAVVGPGILAGLSDDDPAGITTYSILGADYGYSLLWVLLLSTAALVLFHEVGARVGIVTGQGLAGLVRQRYGVRFAAVAVFALVVANVGTAAAEFAGIAAATELAGLSRYVSVPLAAAGVSYLVLRESFHRVEHVLMALGSVFAAYIVSGLIAGPDWSATAKGLAVPTLPLDREAVLVATATVGTTLAPWGLAFIQSYVVDKRLRPADLGFERVDVVVGAVMTGVIGLFVVVACAETLHATGTSVEDASDAARALEPVAGNLASTLFGAGLLASGLLAASILPLSTGYSVSEVLGQESALDDSFAEAPALYTTFGVVVVLGAGIVLVPGAPLVEILFLTQALNAVLLLPLLVFLVGLVRDPEVMGEHASGPVGTVALLAATALVVACVGALAVLTIL